MEDDPHDTQLVQPDEVEEVQALFAAQYADVRMITLYLFVLAGVLTPARAFASELGEAQGRDRHERAAAARDPPRILRCRPRAPLAPRFASDEHGEPRRNNDGPSALMALIPNRAAGCTSRCDDNASVFELLHRFLG